MQMKRAIFITLLCVLSLTVKGQYDNDLFENAMYYSGSWVFNIETFTVNNNPFPINKSNSWFGINIQHFPTEPNLHGNNLLSIDGHFNISPDFNILQFSTGWFFGVCAGAIWSKGKNEHEDAYQRYRSEGYDAETADQLAGNDVDVTDQELQSMIYAYLLALESGGLHIPFGRHAGISADWSLFKVNYHFKDKAWFFTGDVGGSLGFSLGNHILLKAFGRYTFLWEANPYINKGWNWGVSIGYIN